MRLHKIPDSTCRKATAMSILKVVSEKVDKVLRTTTCEYYTPDTIKELSFTEALTPYQPEPCDLFPEGFKEK